jgi:hypothetical protein
MRTGAVVLLAWLVITPSALAKASPAKFAGHTYAVTAAESAAVGNLDKKHGPDLVVAETGNQTVGVMLNKGNGKFASVKPYPACNPGDGGPEAIKLGDVNGDGKLDAVVACPPEVAVLLGKGDGTFKPQKTYGLGVSVDNGLYTQEQIALIRLHQSGPPDLVYKVRANPPFGPQYPCATSDFNQLDETCDGNQLAAGPMAVGRLNSSLHNYQLVTGVPSSNDVAFFGITKTGWADSTRSGGTSYVESAAIGDLNGDGHPDVLMGHLLNSTSKRVAGAITWYLWNPTKGIPPGAKLHTLASIPEIDAVGIGDFNGDHHNDIFAAADSGTAVVHLGDGKGHFNGGNKVPMTVGTRVTFALGDLNCDRQLDAVVSSYYQNALEVLLNTTHKATRASCK